jgi:flavin reductase (DIM6/NTAB) family NADH-FMN oxidoreductase RutF
LDINFWQVSLTKGQTCHEGHLTLFPCPTQINSTSNDHEFEVLPNCATYIQLKLKRVTDGGDHDVAICEVIGTGIWDDTSSTIKWLTETDTATQALDSATVLYTGQLRDEGII